jgi:hypothetical protein
MAALGGVLRTADGCLVHIRIPSLADVDLILIDKLPEPPLDNDLDDGGETIIC